MNPIPITRYAIVPTSFRGYRPRDYLYSIRRARRGLGPAGAAEQSVYKGDTLPKPYQGMEGPEHTGMQRFFTLPGGERLHVEFPTD